MNNKRIICDVESFVRENVPSSRLAQDGSSDSYFRHVFGCRDYAVKLARECGANEFVVEVAALLHDVAADSGEHHALDGAVVAREFLSGLGLSYELDCEIVACIETHSHCSIAETLEAQVVQDADGLIFLEDTFKFFFEKQKLANGLDFARNKTAEKVKLMAGKVKTVQGKSIARGLLSKVLVFLKTAS